MNDKKTSQLLVKLSSDLREAFQAYAQMHGTTASALVRAFIEDELRGGRVMSTLRRPLVDGRWNHKAAEVLDDTGKVYHVQVIPFRSQTTLQISDPETEKGFFDLSKARGGSHMLDKVFAVMDSSYDWDSPNYIQICSELGLNPDDGRPHYKDEDRGIISELNEQIKWGYGGDRGRLNELIFDLLDLLRLDQFPEFYAFERCRGILDCWTFKLPSALFAEAFDRVDVHRMRSSQPIWTVVTFLPSWMGRGYSASIDLFNVKDCQEDGWWESGYHHVRGVALQPTRIDWAMQTVVQHLSAQGVVFLSAEEARSYMDHEGVYWAYSHRSWQCPPGLEPRIPSASEKLAWRIKKPSLPLYEVFLQRTRS